MAGIEDWTDEGGPSAPIIGPIVWKCAEHGRCSGNLTQEVCGHRSEKIMDCSRCITPERENEVNLMNKACAEIHREDARKAKTERERKLYLLCAEQYEQGFSIQGGDGK